MENSSTPSCSACGSWWRLPLLLGLVLAAILWWRGRSPRELPHDEVQTVTGTAAEANAREKVSLAIDFSEGRRKNFEALAWHDGMTVADLLSKAPNTTVMQKGAGESAFLVAIDGLANEGAAGRNWTYTVNGKSADRSFAVYNLQSGDRVLWTFGPRQ